MVAYGDKVVVVTREGWQGGRVPRGVGWVWGGLGRCRLETRWGWQL